MLSIVMAYYDETRAIILCCLPLLETGKSVKLSYHRPAIAGIRPMPHPYRSVTSPPIVPHLWILR
jgi:hypothetical protein